MTPGPVEPLTAEEEVVLRSPATRLYHTELVARLLATLDVAREAATLDRIAPDGLAEAAREMVERGEAFYRDRGPSHRAFWNREIAALRKALESVLDDLIARSEASPVDALGVVLDRERLHAAIREVWARGHSDLRSGLTTGGPNGTLADAIAEVYDRG